MHVRAINGSNLTWITALNIPACLCVHLARGKYVINIAIRSKNIKKFLYLLSLIQLVYLYTNLWQFSRVATHYLPDQIKHLVRYENFYSCLWIKLNAGRNLTTSWCLPYIVFKLVLFFIDIWYIWLLEGIYMWWFYNSISNDFFFIINNCCMQRAQILY